MYKKFKGKRETFLIKRILTSFGVLVSLKFQKFLSFHLLRAQILFANIQNVQLWIPMYFNIYIYIYMFVLTIEKMSIKANKISE